MNIVIIDERNGQVLRPHMNHSMHAADIVMCVEQDNTVRVVKYKQGKPQEVHAEFFDAVHRDVISGEQSEAMRVLREQERELIDSEHSLSARDKAGLALGSDGPVPMRDM